MPTPEELVRSMYSGTRSPIMEEIFGSTNSPEPAQEPKSLKKSALVEQVKSKFSGPSLEDKLKAAASKVSEAYPSYTDNPIQTRAKPSKKPSETKVVINPESGEGKDPNGLKLKASKAPTSPQIAESARGAHGILTRNKAIARSKMAGQKPGTVVHVQKNETPTHKNFGKKTGEWRINKKGDDVDLHFHSYESYEPRDLREIASQIVQNVKKMSKERPDSEWSRTVRSIFKRKSSSQ